LNLRASIVVLTSGRSTEKFPIHINSSISKRSAIVRVQVYHTLHGYLRDLSFSRNVKPPPPLRPTYYIKRNKKIEKPHLSSSSVTKPFHGWTIAFRIMRYNDYNNNVMILLLLYFHFVFSEKSCGKRRVSTRRFPKIHNTHTYSRLTWFTILSAAQLTPRRTPPPPMSPSVVTIIRTQHTLTHNIYRLNINIIIIIITGIMGPKVACLGRASLCFVFVYAYFDFFFFSQLYFLPSVQ